MQFIPGLQVKSQPWSGRFDMIDRYKTGENNE